jgi:hypothetical protein
MLWDEMLLLDAWMLMLEGRENEVKPLFGVDRDPWATLGTRPRETYKLATKKSEGWALIRFALGHVGDWWRKQEYRMIVVSILGCGFL